MKHKIIGTKGTTQTRNQVCRSRRNDMTTKIDIRLAHRRNLCSGKKDQVIYRCIGTLRLWSYLQCVENRDLFTKEVTDRHFASDMNLPNGDERRLVKELLADPSAPDLETATTAGGNTLLHVSASGGHAALAALLLRRAPGLLAARNAALDTPLHLAARAGAHKVAALLIASSPSTPSLRALTRATNKRGETALHNAVRGGHEAAARALAAADPGLAGLRGGAGETPIYMATAAGSLGMVRVLIKSYKYDDADEDEVPRLCSCTGPGRRTALHAAVLTSNGECLTRHRLVYLVGYYIALLATLQDACLKYFLHL
uniref:Uncharacterized protein n=1 Tax=Aegilops tauschii TaxID=37682 RepID=M8AVE0_AEGTA